MFSRLPPALVLTGAIVAGSAMDATIKFLSMTNHVLLVAFGRYLFGALFSFAIWQRAGMPVITKEMWRAHGLRGFVIAACAVLFFWSLSILPLAEAVTLSFIYPLLAPFVAAVILKERIRASSLICALVGFAGVIIAMQGAPGTADSPQHAIGVTAVLVSAAFFSIAMVLLRERAQKDGAPIVGLMTSFIPGVILLIPTIAFATPPTLSDWPFFFQLGALAAVFMYLMAQAYARAEAQQLAPIHYTELLWASVIGYIIFRETPRPEIYAGAALIVAACLYAAYDERRLTRLKEQT
ncbi:DMT family transporter [Vitreimonas flagellata]|uniref:DMT family transporter n=1 Tax=Vitreimonas flagellata TaxID=2560861 RepID=UPI001075119E|nr:DMT family transporter [Vitreimonas flagellata]